MASYDLRRGVQMHHHNLNRSKNDKREDSECIIMFVLCKYLALCSK